MRLAATKPRAYRTPVSLFSFIILEKEMFICEYFIGIFFSLKVLRKFIYIRIRNLGANEIANKMNAFILKIIFHSQATSNFSNRLINIIK